MSSCCETVRPYYEHDGITIYHGDCRDVLDSFSCDLIITDPPYGIHVPITPTGFFSAVQHDGATWDNRPDAETLWRIAHKAPLAVIWGFGYFAGVLGSCVAPLVWDKCTGANVFADGELAWTSFTTGTLRIFRHQWCGAFKDSERRLSAEHPTQKPAALMRWCISQADKRQQSAVICDPFMGSGTTLVAAKFLGRQAIGVDINERYCEIAARRLAQGILPLYAE